MDTLKDFLIMMFLKFKISFATIFLLIIPLSILPYDGSNKFVDNVDIRKQFDSLIRRGDANMNGVYEREFHDTVWYDSLRNCLSKNPDDKEVSLKLVTYRLLNDSAIYNYKNALLIYPEDDETLLKLAIIYDEMDSVKLAEKYYKKVKKRFITLTNNYTNTEYPEIDVNKLKMNLTYCDSLEILFKQYGRESSVTFDFEIATSVFPTYNNDHIENFLIDLFRKKIFITVYGNGEFEARKFDSLKKSKVFFEGKLPDSTLSIILKTLQKGKILSLKSLLQNEKKSVNRFWGQYAINYILYAINLDSPYFYRITIETPIVSNSASIAYLIGCDFYGNFFNKSCCDDINLNYDNMQIDKTEAKIKLLEELWKYIYCIDLSKYSLE